MRPAAEDRYYGKYRGTVSSNEDTKARGRLKVRVPAVFGSVEVWAMPCVPYAGAGTGFYSLPEVDSGVWIEFEGGDPRFPIWVGCFWAEGELPHDNGPGERVWQSAAGTIQLRDPSGSKDPVIELSIAGETGTLVTLDGSELRIDAGSSTLEISAKKIVSKAKSGSKLELGATAKINDDSLEVL